MKLPNSLKDKDATVKKNKDEKNIIENEIHIEEMQNYQFEYFSDFDNEKALTNHIKYIEKMIRSSYEYKKYIGFLKNEQDLTHCEILKAINCKDMKKVKIEMHHYPFNLFEIVNIVILSQSCNYCNPINDFSICNEIMRLHYENKIGLVPLSQTAHQLFHSGELFLSLNSVYGNVQGFIDDYEDFIPDELMENLNKLSEISQKESSDTHNKYILAEKISFMNIDNQKSFHKLNLEENQDNKSA